LSPTLGAQQNGALSRLNGTQSAAVLKIFPILLILLASPNAFSIDTLTAAERIHMNEIGQMADLGGQSRNAKVPRCRRIVDLSSCAGALAPLDISPRTTANAIELALSSDP
jgi:hypothetical protein